MNRLLAPRLGRLAIAGWLAACALSAQGFGRPAGRPLAVADAARTPRVTGGPPGTR